MRYSKRSFNPIIKTQWHGENATMNKLTTNRQGIEENRTNEQTRELT